MKKKYACTIAFLIVFLVLIVFIMYVIKRISYNNVSVEHLENDIDVCFAAENYTTSGMNKCIYKTISKLEKEIKQYNFLILKKLSQSQKEAFRENINIWEKYKESQINLINNLTDNKEGTIYQNINAGSILGIYKSRITFLKELYGIIYE